MDKLFWNKKNVLVTGGTGLVGGHIAEQLVWAGANVVVPYRSINPKSYFVSQKLNEKCVMAICDIKDYLRVADIISRYQIEYIFHLAAQPIVPIAYVNPYETLQTNISGTINVLEAARHCPHVAGIVVASSDKAYGKSDVLPYCEDTHFLRGEHPYDVSKSSADLIANMYHKTYGLPVAVTRFGNIYGAGDLNFSRIIPGAIISAIRGVPLQLRSDGKMLREYVYVKNVADGYILLAENIEQAKGDAYNFGSGERLTVLDAVKKVQEAIGKEIIIEILNNCQNEIGEQFLSYEKINKRFGWKPQHRIEEGLKETIDWYKEIFS